MINTYNIYHTVKQIGQKKLIYNNKIDISNYLPDNYIKPINNFISNHNDEDLFVLCPGYGLNSDIQFGITGKAKYKETAYQAAVRECLEETGLIYLPSSELTNINNIDTQCNKINKKKKITQYFFFNAKHLKVYNSTYHKHIINHNTHNKDDLSKRVAIYIFGSYRDLSSLVKQLDNYNITLTDDIQRLLIVPFKKIFNTVAKQNCDNYHWKNIHQPA
jgi:hypothetical protein